MTDLTQTIARIIDPDAFNQSRHETAKWKRTRRDAALAKARQSIPLIEAGVREECARIAEGFPPEIMQLFERPGGPPGNFMRATTPKDIAAAIRAGKDGGG